MSSAGIAAALPQNQKPPVPGADTASAYLAKGDKLSDQMQGQVSSAMTAFQKKEDDADKLEASLDPNALTPPKLAPMPKASDSQTDPIKEWGSAAMAVAALGGLFTRQPLTTSLNAASGVMNAYRSRDQEAAKTAFDNWKTANQNAIDAAKWSVDAYKDALERIKEDRDGGKAELLAVAAALKDNTIPYMMEHYGVDAVVKLVGDQERAVTAMEVNAPKIEIAQTQANLGLAALGANTELEVAKKSGDPTKIAAAQEKYNGALQDAQAFNSAIGKGGGAGGSLISDADALSMADQYLAGDKSVISGLGYGNTGAANRAKVQHAIREQARALGMSGADIAANIAEFQGVTAGERTLGTTSARIGLGAAEMQTLVPLVKEASKELPRTNYPTMNAFIQGAERETGNPKLRNLAVRLQGLKSAYSQVLTRGGVPTDAARSATDELFNTKDPETVLDTVLDAMGQETAAIKRAPGIVRGELRTAITDKTAPGPAQFQAMLDKAGGNIDKAVQNEPDDKTSQALLAWYEKKKNIGPDRNQGTAAPKFENGKIYKDANGNRAEYQNGQWVVQ
jgi:hypothetical protein